MVVRFLTRFLSKAHLWLITAFLMTVFMSFVVAAPAHAATSFTASGRVSSPEGAYLRQGASKSTKAVAVLKNKTKLTIKGEVFVSANNPSSTKKWFHVQAGKRKGYIRSDLVKITKYNSKKAYAIDYLNYRTGAGTSMKRIATISKNSSISIVLTAKPKGSNKTWYRIKKGSSYYYVCSDWVSFSKPKAVNKATQKASTSDERNNTNGSNKNDASSQPVPQSSAAKKVASNAADWAIRIANDNSFHYGNGGHAHHNGCYFCGTQPKSKRKYVVKWEKTYCCNPFVQAAYAHGGKEPTMLKLCQNGGSYVEKNYKKSPLFQNLGKPSKAALIKGDVLCCVNGHVMIYVGDGKLAEAANGDDGKVGSTEWNNSISVSSLSNNRWNNKSYGVCSVFRYIGK